MNCLSVCLFPLNDCPSYLESRLKRDFVCLRVDSVDELQICLEKHDVFCVLIGCGFNNMGILNEVKAICDHSTPKQVFFYSGIVEQDTIFELSKLGISHCISHPNTVLLINELRHLRELSDFRIDLNDFDIDINHCSFWTRKFLKFILDDSNYLKTGSVMTVSNRLGISIEHLDRTCKKDIDLSPKQLLLGLKIYHLLYRLHLRPACSAKKIILQQGFQNVYGFYKAFHKKTGYTIYTFRRQIFWRDFPQIYIKVIKRNSNKKSIL